MSCLPAVLPAPPPLPSLSHRCRPSPTVSLHSALMTVPFSSPPDSSGLPSVAGVPHRAWTGAIADVGVHVAAGLAALLGHPVTGPSAAAFHLILGSPFRPWPLSSSLSTHPASCQAGDLAFYCTEERGLQPSCPVSVNGRATYCVQAPRATAWEPLTSLLLVPPTSGQTHAVSPCFRKKDTTPWEHPSSPFLSSLNRNMMTSRHVSLNIPQTLDALRHSPDAFTGHLAILLPLLPAPAPSLAL